MIKNVQGIKTEEMIEKLEEYEGKQFRKAFDDGREKAWDRYRRNVLRRVNRLKKVYGISVDLDSLLA